MEKMPQNVHNDIINKEIINNYCNLVIHGNFKNMERSALQSNLLKNFVVPHLTTVAGREFQGLPTRQEKKCA